MNRRSILIPVAVLAATVAVSPASAADGNGWQCISPFANFTNATYPDDPPAPGSILDTLAISVTLRHLERATSAPRRAAQRRRGRIGGGGVGRPSSYVKQLPRC